MNLAYGWRVFPELNKGWLGRFLAFLATAKKERLLVSALGLRAGNTSLRTLLFVYIYSPKGQYSKEMKCKEHESQPSLEIKWYSLLPNYLLLPNLNPLFSKGTAEPHGQMHCLHSLFNWFLVMTL